MEAEEVEEDELLQSRKREVPRNSLVWSVFGLFQVLGEQNLWPPLVRWVDLCFVKAS